MKMTREGFEELVVFAVLVLAAVAVGKGLWLFARMGV